MAEIRYYIVPSFVATNEKNSDDKITIDKSYFQYDYTNNKLNTNIGNVNFLFRITSNKTDDSNYYADFEKQPKSPTLYYKSYIKWQSIDPKSIVYSTSYGSIFSPIPTYINNAAPVTINAIAQSSGVFDFASSGTSVLNLAVGQTDFGLTVASFTSNNAIQIVNSSNLRLSFDYTTDILTLSNGEILRFSGDYSPYYFSIAPSSNGFGQTISLNTKPSVPQSPIFQPAAARVALASPTDIPASLTAMNGKYGTPDTIVSRSKSDAVSYASAAGSVVVDLGAQISWDGSYNDTLVGIENVIGSSANDIFFGDDRNNVFDGNGGADQIYGGGGSDTVSFATKSTSTLIDFTYSINGVVINLGGETWDGNFNTKLISVENAVGTKFNDVIYGNAGNNVIEGGTGADTIYGGDGTDTVSFKSSDTAVVVDLRFGTTWDGRYNDRIFSVENAIGSRFGDTMYGDASDNLFEGGGGADLINGGAGNDTIGFGGATGPVIVDLRTQTTWDGTSNAMLTSIENVIGSGFADIILGDAGDNLIDGGEGADTIDGGTGSDTISFVNAANAVVVDLAARLTWDGASNDTLTSIENVIGSRFNDTIRGDAGDNLIQGDGGADQILGGAGNDTVAFTHASGPVTIDLGSQLTWDGQSNSTLSSIENAIGSRYSDVIFGDDGNNLIDGGGGADTVYGSAGNDTISFATSKSSVTIDLAYQSTWDGLNNVTLSSIENAIGSKFNDTILAGDERNMTPDGILTGNGGSDTFGFHKGFGHQVITDFARDDIIKVERGLFTNDDILGSAVDYGGGVLLKAAGQGDIALVGVRLNDLYSGNFTFF